MLLVFKLQLNKLLKGQVRSQIKGWLTLQKKANLMVNMLQTSQRLSLGLQAKKQDPVKQVQQIWFTRTMTKLQITNNNMLDDDHEPITYYKHLQDSLSKKTVDDRPDEMDYQGIKLKNYHNF